MVQPPRLLSTIDNRREMLEKLMAIAKEMDVSLPQLMIAWTLRLPEISSSIMGASKPEQVIDNAGAADVSIPTDVLKTIEAILANKPESVYR